MRDMEIREALERELKNEHALDPNTLILHELGLCQGTSRVDMAVINGAITGYEIKSPKDTLNRLPGQKEIYSKTLDRVVIITGENHLQQVEKMVPVWWGIQVPYMNNDQVVFFSVRESSENPQIDPFSLVKLLWRDEALEELTLLNMDRGVRSKPREVVWERLANSVSVEILSEIVRTRLKARTNWRVD